MSRNARPTILLAVVFAVLAVSAPAQAQISIGHVPGFTPPVACGGASADIIQSGSSVAPNPYVVPFTGVITSWSTNAASSVGQTFKFKVFRPIVGTSFGVVAQDGPRALAAGVLNSFPVNIPVQAGDLIGVNDQTSSGVMTACLVATGVSTDVFATANGDAAKGSTVSLAPIAPGYALNLATTLVRPATITSVVPAEGSVKGGTAVAISGTEFIGSTAVTFGGIPATTFTVVSDTQIAAVAPASTKPGAVDLTVTNAAGASAAVTADRFTYLACVVPKLNGKTLKADRKRLKKAGCKLGNVSGERSKSAKTVKQNPKPGKVLAPGAKVGVKLES